MPKSVSGDVSLPAGLQAVRRGLSTAAVISSSIVLAATLCAASARFNWFGDLLTHFRLQYAALSLLSVILLIWLKRSVLAGIAFATLVINITTASSALGWHTETRMAAQAAVTRPEHALRVASINVLYSNEQYARVVAFLREQKPDAVVLVEITPQWRSALEALSDVYSYRYHASSSPTQRLGVPVERGVLLLSRWPIEHAARIDLGSWTEPGVLATLNVRGKQMHVMGVHPCWPLGWAISAERNRELAQIAELARSTPGPLVVLGDFNITAFSPFFQKLLSQGELRSATDGSSWKPTWPTFFPLAGIQIDHALVSRDIQVIRFQTGPSIGSDHWPILVDLVH